MANYIRPNLSLIIVAQSVSLESQKQLMGLFWTLALAVILLFLFVGVMMAMVRVIRRRTRLNEQAKAKQKAQLLADPWDEAGRRLKESEADTEQTSDFNGDIPESDADSRDEPEEKDDSDKQPPSGQ